MFSANLGLGPSVELTEAEARENFFRTQYAVITALAEAIMMQEWCIEVRDGDGWVEAPGHEAEVLLQEANPAMTGPELTYWTAVELLMIGKAHLLKVMDGMLGVKELWPMLGTGAGDRGSCGLLDAFSAVAVCSPRGNRGELARRPPCAWCRVWLSWFCAFHFARRLRRGLDRRGRLGLPAASCPSRRTAWADRCPSTCGSW